MQRACQMDKNRAAFFAACSAYWRNDNNNWIITTMLQKGQLSWFSAEVEMGATRPQVRL